MATHFNSLTQQPLTDVELAQLTTLIERKLAIDAEVEVLNKQLAARQEVLHKLEFDEIPERMNELGMREFVLTDGSKIKLKPIYSCYMNDESPEAAQLKQRALAWLRANNLATIIKNMIKVALTSGDDKKAKQIRTFLDKHAVPYTADETVHNATLRALMKERIESGKEFPLDIFRGFHGKKAVIEIPE